MLWRELEETACLLNDLYVTLYAQEIYKMLKLKNKYQSKYYIDNDGSFTIYPYRSGVPYYFEKI